MSLTARLLPLESLDVVSLSPDGHTVSIHLWNHGARALGNAGRLSVDSFRRQLHIL